MLSSSTSRTSIAFLAGAAAAWLVERLVARLSVRRLSLMDLSPMVANMQTSKTVAIFSKTSDMKSRGEAVNAALCVGQPDFPPPAAALKATGEATELGLTAYTAVSGTLELRRAICKYLRELKGTDYGVEQIMVACGGKQAIYEVTLATCQAGDEVIIPAPYYTSHPDIVALSGATPVILPTTAADDYVPTVAGLAALLTPRTRMIILCNPCNPSGTVIPRARLEELAVLLRRPEHAHVLVLSDEIYSEITYDVPHVSFAALPGMMERTLTINGFSKAGGPPTHSPRPTVHTHPTADDARATPPPVPPAMRPQGEPACLPLSPSPPLPATPWSRAPSPVPSLSHAFACPALAFAPRPPFPPRASSLPPLAARSRTP